MDLSKHLEKAEDAVKRRNYPLAVKVYTQLLGLQPDYGEARAGLREALFRKAEARKPSRALAMVLGGVSLLIAKLSTLFRAHAGAARAYERYLALDPLHEPTNLALATALERAGFGQSALAVYRAWAQQQPRCLVASRRAGQLLYEAGQHQEALAMFEQALKVDPRDQDSLRARKNLAAEGALRKSGLETATSARELLKDQDAVRQIERSQRLQLTPEEIEAETAELEGKLAERPEDIAVLGRLATLHEMRGDPHSALGCLERALVVQPDRSEIAARAGDLRLRLQEERVKAAEKSGDAGAAARARQALVEARVGEFRRRVQQQPTDLGLRFELGRALADAGSHDDAIAELQQAVKDPRKRTEALLALARAFRAKGLDDLAQSQLNKALEAAGGVRGSLGKEIAYELGAVAESMGSARDALQHYQAILEQDIGFRDVDQKVQRLRAAT